MQGKIQALGQMQWLEDMDILFYRLTMKQQARMSTESENLGAGAGLQQAVDKCNRQ